MMVALSGCLLAGSEHGSGGGDDTSVPDGGGGGGGGNLVCNDDSSFGFNDSISSAFVTGVATQTQSISFVGLAICPAGDRDVYEFDLFDGGSLQTFVNWDFGFPALKLSILNSSGTVIVSGVPGGDGTSAFTCAANLPPGSYFAQVEGSSSGVQNNYSLSADVVPGCN
jgi:hypothetical protein